MARIRPLEKSILKVTQTEAAESDTYTTVHTHRASVHRAAKLVAARLRGARLTAGLTESNGSLPPGL